MVGRATALLALAGALVGWFELSPHLGGLALWPSVLVVSFALMPAFFALSWIALPLWRSRRLVPIAAALVALALLLSLINAPVLSNIAKFAAVTTAGWAFLTLFESVSWVVTVALIIPFVDAYSVWRGPTHAITTGHPAVFSTLSIAFVTPGGVARLGLPDVLFFSVFLAASARFALRPGVTWVAMMVGLALTMVLTTVWATNGLPALPGISLGFLVANADLLWRRRARPGAQARAEASSG